MISISGHVIGLSMLLAFAYPVDARACQCSFPSLQGFVAQDGALPANARGVLWYSSDGLLTPPRQEHFEVFLHPSDPHSTPVDFELEPTEDPRLYKLVPDAGFVPGETYVFVAHGVELIGEEKPPEGSRDVLRVTVSETTLESASTLTLRAEPAFGPIEAPMLGACSGFRELPHATLTLELPEAVEPFKEQLVYTTLVNDAPWQAYLGQCHTPIPGRTSFGAARDRVYGACGSSLRIYITARLPGTSVVFTSETLELTLRCDPP